MTRFGLLCISLMFGALFSGCSGECSSAFDCKIDEVCFKAICTPASASYLACSSNTDCADDPNFECRGGSCRLLSTSPGVIPADAGPADTGMTPDTGTTPDTGILPDAGTSTTTDAGS